MNEVEELTKHCIKEWFHDYNGHDPNKKLLCWIMDEKTFGKYKKLTGCNRSVRRFETCAGLNYAVPVN
ncbi:MAG: hypothetical protein GY749_39845 [Desulfobacteraceae bacterium]|nr:hypothetical protein [Desulfobacteraceae bacterium]